MKQTLSVTFTLNIDSPLSYSGPLPPGGTVGTPYSFTFGAPTGGVGPYTFSVTAGSSLPPGLALSAAGVLSGTPTTAGNYSCSVDITDSGN